MPIVRNKISMSYSVHLCVHVYFSILKRLKNEEPYKFEGIYEGQNLFLWLGLSEV